MPIETAPIALTTALGSGTSEIEPSPNTATMSFDLLTAPAVKTALGGISEMTLWRWTKTLGFRAPDLIIARRKFWRRRTIQTWLAERETRKAE